MCYKYDLPVQNSLSSDAWTDMKEKREEKTERNTQLERYMH